MPENQGFDINIGGYTQGHQPHVLPRMERMVGSSQTWKATSTALVNPTQNPM